MQEDNTYTWQAKQSIISRSLNAYIEIKERGFVFSTNMLLRGLNC